MQGTEEYRFPFLIVGVGLGILAGILWSPRAGKEMREELRRGALEGFDVLNQQGDKFRIGADRWFTKISEYFGRAKGRADGSPREPASRLE